MPLFNSMFDSYRYDDIMSRAIRHALDVTTNIKEIPNILLNFFDSCDQSESQSNEHRSSKPKWRGPVDSIALATGIGSVISELMVCLLKEKPQHNVEEYLQRVLQEKVELKAVSKLLDFKKMAAKPESKTICVLVLGIQNVGKTTLISVLKGNKNPKTKPSMGFRPEILAFNDYTKVKFFDIGGGQKIRGVWANYMHDAHAVIFVIDSACSNEVYQESLSVAKQSLGHKYCQGKPLLVISNKRDLSESRPLEAIKSDMNLNVVPSGGITNIVEMTIHPMFADSKWEPDPNIDTSIEWLLNVSLENFVDLNERVLEDGKEVQVLRQKKKDERVKRVLSSSLCKAFGLQGEEVSEVFDAYDGEDFMAHEVGLAGRKDLPVPAKKLCSLVGYQRFAMMIVGSIVTTQNEGSPQKSWEDAIEFVEAARNELGL